MAKMKISELATEINVDKNEIVAYLQETGFECKSATKSIEDEQINDIKAHFSKSAAKPAKSAAKAEDKAAKAEPKTEAKAESKAEAKTEAKAEAKAESKADVKAETKSDAKAESKAEAKAEDKAEAVKGAVKAAESDEARKAAAPDGMKKKRPEGEMLKKKKSTVIIVGGNNGNRNARPGQAQSARPVAATPAKNVVLGPNQMINKATGKIMEKLPPKKMEEPEEEIVAPVVEEKPEVVETVKQENTAPVSRDNQAQDRGNRNNDRGMQDRNGNRQDRNVQDRSDRYGQDRNGQDRNSQDRNGQDRSDRNGQERSNRGDFNQNRGGDRGQNRFDKQDRRDGRTDARGDRGERGQQGDGRNSRNFDNRDRNGFAGGKNRDNNQGGGQFGNRNASGDSRGQGRDGRSSDKYRDNKQNSFMDAPVGGKPTENRRANGNQNRDKRSKKDAIYEEEDLKTKNSNKAGRFIKPEKKEEVVEEIKVITLPEVITIKELAEKMKMQPSVIVKKLFLQGQMVTVNQEVTYEEAENIAIEFDIMCEQEVKVDVIEELLKEEEEDEATLIERAPVICVMGHVDHGKTSLLDAIRKTNVTDKEAGGITQHIGAYMVEAGGRKITFLDTPGHEAFTAMRMRGANATDIAILVVAADDGVMPQTIEAINHAKAAGIEIIVAVNKIDKPSANVDRVKQELTEYGLVAEDWGGDTVFAPVSAKTGEGIMELLDMVLLTADILELKANPKRKARGLVIEAELDKGRGPVATILMQKGTLKVGDFVSAGACHGKVRAMIDDKGRRVKEAGPSTPVEILGLNDVPEAGEVFIAHDSDKTAKSFADTYKAQNKVKKLEETKSKMSLDDVFSQIKEGNLKELNLIVKADVQGSVEAVKQSLTKLSNEEVVVKCIHGGVGAVNESDVSLAAASNAIIIGFNVRIDTNAKETAEHEGVDVRLYKVIYQAIDDVEAAMKGMLDPVFEEKIIGHAEVRQIFKASAVGNIAGSYVLDGVFQRNCKVRITREGEQIYEGELASLKRFKDDVKEVKTGFECGLVFDGFDAMQELDIVEAYIMVEVPR